MNLIKIVQGLFGSAPKNEIVLPKPKKVVAAGKLVKGQMVCGQVVASVEHINQRRKIGLRYVRIHFKDHGSWHMSYNDSVELD